MTGEEGTSGGSGTPQILERAFALLSLFDEARPDWTTTEAAREIGLPVPTAHRILGVLHREGYLSRDADNKRYELGPNALLLGRRAEALLDITRLATPLLERLALITDEVALLTELNQRRDGVVCRLRVDGSQPLRLSVKPGNELPLYAGAMQKALLAFLPDRAVDSICSGTLEPLCRATITRPERLRANLAEVRRRGWAISYEETNEGAWGIAIPIVDSDGAAVAAIGLAGPRTRLQVTEVHDQLHALHEGATGVARRLGLHVPSLHLDNAPVGTR
jgi:IclR family transcriptional regulator, acetate operon repressor